MAKQFDTGIFSVIGVDSAVLPGALLNWYVSGTSTRADTYSTDALDPSLKNTNPVVAAADGRFGPIWQDTGDFQYVLTDADGNVLVGPRKIIVEGAVPTIDTDLTDFLAGTDPLPIANGGTGASSAASARVNLGVQPLDADLTAIAALVTSADKFPYATGLEMWALATVTSAARTMLAGSTAEAIAATIGAVRVTAVSMVAAGGYVKFAFTIASTLYQPIFQWGSNSVAANSATAITYPTPFATWSVAVGSGGVSDAAAQDNDPVVASCSTASFSVFSARDEANTFFWLAWGI